MFKLFLIYYFISLCILSEQNYYEAKYNVNLEVCNTNNKFIMYPWPNIKWNSERSAHYVCVVAGCTETAVSFIHLSNSRLKYWLFVEVCTERAHVLECAFYLFYGEAVKSGLRGLA